MNKTTNRLLVNKNSSIKQAMRIIDRAGFRTAFVVDGDKKLVGAISDGDIRKALLKGKDINISVQEIMNKEPIFLKKQDLTNHYLVQRTIKKIRK